MSGWSPPGMLCWGGRAVLYRCGDLEPRHRAVLRGSVESLRVHRGPTGFMSMDAVLADDSGQVLLRWLGRRSIPGIAARSSLMIEGTVLAAHGQLVIWNPLYAVQSSGGSLGRR